MADVYYYDLGGSGGSIYYNNIKKNDNYTKRGDSYYTAQNRRVRIELNDGKFILPANCNNLFYGAVNTTFDTSVGDWTDVTDTQHMFDTCTKMTSLDVSNFDVSNVTNMYRMFFGCPNLTYLDVSNGDTSKVTSMAQTFSGLDNCNIVGLKNLNTSNVTQMSGMIDDNHIMEELDLSGGDVSKVQYIDSIFSSSDYKKIYLLGGKLDSCRSVQTMFYDDSSLEAIVTDEDTDGSTYPNLNGQRMFHNNTSLSNGNGTDGLENANTNPGGYFTIGHMKVKYLPFEKVEGVGTSIDLYCMDSEGGKSQEVYM